MPVSKSCSINSLAGLLYFKKSDIPTEAQSQAGIKRFFYRQPRTSKKNIFSF